MSQNTQLRPSDNFQQPIAVVQVKDDLPIPFKKFVEFGNPSGYIKLVVPLTADSAKQLRKAYFGAAAEDGGLFASFNQSVQHGYIKATLSADGQTITLDATNTVLNVVQPEASDEEASDEDEMGSDEAEEDEEASNEE